MLSCSRSRLPYLLLFTGLSGFFIWLNSRHTEAVVYETDCQRHCLTHPSTFSEEAEQKIPANTQEEEGVAAPAVPSSHDFQSNGLLALHPNGRHPILDLIKEGEKRWRENLEKQSKTLEEAVREYQRRYGRLPPQGFDHWWSYVVQNGVQLVDEYDQIYRDLEPFYGSDPATLIQDQKNLEGQRHTYTLVNTKDRGLVVESSNVGDSDAKKSQGQLGFLEDVAHFIPEFRATFSIHDGSSKNMYHDFKKQFLEATRTGKYFDPESLPDPKVNGFHWEVVCPPETPMQNYLSSATVANSQFPQKPKSFIHDHLLTMDPCHHPSHSLQIGFLHSRREGPLRKPVPLFVISKSTIHSEILAVAPDQLFLDAGNDPEWDDKPDERLVWRGSNTGISFRSGGDTNWRESQRVRLITLTTRQDGVVDVLMPPPTAVARSSSSLNPRLETQKIKYSRINPAFMDIAFVGKPVQCDEVTCEVIARDFEFRKKIFQSDANRYKYFMDVDGNAWSARFRKLMSTNSLVFKSTVFPEWFTDRIQPWVHYVPIQVDYSDLYDTLTFFRGDLSGNNAHDELAKKIAMEGKRWVSSYWRQEDMKAYMWRLMLEYSRVMTVDRDAASFKL